MVASWRHWIEHGVCAAINGKWAGPLLYPQHTCYHGSMIGLLGHNTSE